MNKFFLFPFLIICFSTSYSQKFNVQTLESNHWADSIFASLTPKQKIAQLIIIRAHSNLGLEHIQKVSEIVNLYDVGGLCFFQGGPIRQTILTNYYQSITKTPLMICMDAEWGLGMRLDSVTNFPKQMMLGAVQNPRLIYEFGKAVGLQCKRMGVHVNYAPVVDINNNSENPVINDRSFGENKYKVAQYGIEYVKGMQDVGIMACAKHFPGHGDVTVDSHFDLPIINKTKAELDSLELYPFRKLINFGVGSMMVAHLFVPAIDSIKNQATSLSSLNINGLLKKELKFNGLIFTDALEMKGVTKFYPSGEAAVKSLIAGNDMLCLPESIPEAIDKILVAINEGRLNWFDIDVKVRKVLMAKYWLGLNKRQTIDTTNITENLNSATSALNKKVSQAAITLLRLEKAKKEFTNKKKLLFIGVGISSPNTLSSKMEKELSSKIFLIDYQDSTKLDSLQKIIKDQYKTIIIGIHNYSRKPANNFGVSNKAMELIQVLSKRKNVIVFDFGNPYVIKNFCHAKNLLACYEDDSITQATAMDWLQGKIKAKGVLPVTICPEFKFGYGIKNK